MRWWMLAGVAVLVATAAALNFARRPPTTAERLLVAAQQASADLVSGLFVTPTAVSALPVRFATKSR